ncbi:hypothetical protein IH992_06550 [Candidatus Poribacteria bacterium]|nr:hypothetical protein [Candidatus Poribacteria bacterium]
MSLTTLSKTLNRYRRRKGHIRQLRKQRKQKIFDMYLACYTQAEIAAEVCVVQNTVKDELALSTNLEELPKQLKLHASFNDPDFKPPIYNVWTFAKKTNAVKHATSSWLRMIAQGSGQSRWNLNGTNAKIERIKEITRFGLKKQS